MAPERRLRAYGLVLGVLFFLWLPFEDTHTRYALLLAAGLSAWLGLRYGVRFAARRYLFGYALLGVLVGLAVAPVALALMAVKVGLHAHGFSDFTLSQILAIFESAPWWALAGGIAGGLGGFLSQGQTPESV
jgi:hypothetical protein